MRLKVNGVEVRVVDRIEIELDVARDGEDLIHGLGIKVRGGELSIRPVASGEAALMLTTERLITFHAGTRAAISVTRESADPYRPDQATEYAITLKHNGSRDEALPANAGPQSTPFQTYRVFYSLQAAQMEGETRHAEVVMMGLASKLGFTVRTSEPQSLFDGWEFWIKSPAEPQLPPYVRIVPSEPMPTRKPS